MASETTWESTASETARRRASSGYVEAFRNRRLTRDSRIPDFSRKKIRKNRKNRFFGVPGPKSNFEIFMIFLYDQHFVYKPLFFGS